MKTKITKTDGTIIEAEGTIEELVKLLAPFVPAPVFPFTSPAAPEPSPAPYPTVEPYVIGGCAAGGICEYPSPWMAIIPPSCTKCGKQAMSSTPMFMTCSG